MTLTDELLPPEPPISAPPIATDVTADFTMTALLKTMVSSMETMITQIGQAHTHASQDHNEYGHNKK